jgi:oligopeptide/dipeptide ABC transporter ATP-binding protein
LLSGGQLQRVGIGRILILQPKLIIADEPVSMLDVSVSMGILRLLENLRDKFGISFIYITHDLATARILCDRIAIMYLGKIVEIAPTEDLLKKPLHPYTQALLAAVPIPDPRVNMEEIPIIGYVPLIPSDAFTSCRFYPRCPYSEKKCREQDPPLIEASPGHFVSCVRVK